MSDAVEALAFRRFIMSHGDITLRRSRFSRSRRERNYRSASNKEQCEALYFIIIYRAPIARRPGPDFCRFTRQAIDMAGLAMKRQHDAGLLSIDCRSMRRRYHIRPSPRSP